jgi:protein translocase SecG subunit
MAPQCDNGQTRQWITRNLNRMLQLIFSLTTLWWMILFLYIPACFGLIIIVLLQKGKGQGLAGAFGMGGGMDTIFGPRSSKSLPQKITYASAAIFMILALIMSILSGKVGRSAAPEKIEETPQATMEALFDPNTAPSEATSISVTAEGESAEGETATTPAAAAPSLEGITIEQPALEISVEEPAAEAPAETPAETPEATPADAPVVEVPAEAPAETPVVEVPVEAPVAETVVEETPVETPAEAPEETPAEAPAE